MTGQNSAIIGGTGFERLPAEIFAEEFVVETEFGMVPVLSVSNNYVEPQKLFFLSRHGSDHALAPHQINYRANIAALVELGVCNIYASNAVGSLRLSLPPGSFVLFDDFIDMTRARELTFAAEGKDWKHTDFSVPYDPVLRRCLLEEAAAIGSPVLPHATYLCCDGPRFESPAEIRLFASWGADVVGMTGLPEAIFAREAGMKYAALGIVTNYGAGLTRDLVDHGSVTELMASKLPLVRELLIGSSARLYQTDQVGTR